MRRGAGSWQEALRKREGRWLTMTSALRDLSLTPRTLFWGQNEPSGKVMLRTYQPKLAQLPGSLGALGNGMSHHSLTPRLHLWDAWQIAMVPSSVCQTTGPLQPPLPLESCRCCRQWVKPSREVGQRDEPTAGHCLPQFRGLKLPTRSRKTRGKCLQNLENRVFLIIP